MKTVTTERLKTLKAEGKDFLLVNTLDANHFGQTQIPDSINIPLSQDNFTGKVLDAAGSKQKLVVVYCASADCDSSTKAAKELEEAGFNVADYEGGAAAWKASGEPLAV
ncbi:rhodanese-like domain-containing protein [Rhodopirellula sp. JC639]|uniref:rhodanese-like domain-containing protein n=1 Tax=Stieleria mannarensis TaxID=2755585 RepID=UPI00160472EB|nr:rhodanese-like domain-containing protein [Rhodopirellula sp. JC639]